MTTPLLCFTAAVSIVALTTVAEARSAYDGSWDLVFVTPAQTGSLTNALAWWAHQGSNLGGQSAAPSPKDLRIGQRVEAESLPCTLSRAPPDAALTTELA